MKVVASSVFYVCAAATLTDESSSLLQKQRTVGKGKACVGSGCDPVTIPSKSCEEWFVERGQGCDSGFAPRNQPDECVYDCTHCHCCEPLPHCSDNGFACGANHQQKSDWETIQCAKKQCQVDECCDPNTCADLLGGGSCPAKYSDKDLSQTCNNCNPMQVLETCCEPYPRCEGYTCPDKFTLKANIAEHQCDSPTCQDEECCEPTCAEIWPCSSEENTLDPTAVCVGCSKTQCCQPTCASSLTVQCDSVANHGWKDGVEGSSPCLGSSGHGCTVMEAHNQCCEAEEAVIPPAAVIKHCTLYGDPHMNTFDGRSLLPQTANNAAYKVGYFWLVNHPKVKIQAHFVGANGNGDGYSSLKAIAMEVDGVLVSMKRSNGMNKVTVNGVERNVPFSHARVEVVSVENLAEAGLAANHGNSPLQENHGKSAVLIRFPQFKDHHDVEYVKVYLRGDMGALNAAIFMAKASDLPSSSKVSGLCGDSDGKANNDNDFQEMNKQKLLANAEALLPGLTPSGADATTKPFDPVLPTCDPNQRIVATGHCEQCLNLDLHNRDVLLEECINDRCAQLPSETLTTECDFINEIGSLD